MSIRNMTLKGLKIKIAQTLRSGDFENDVGRRLGGGNFRRSGATGTLDHGVESIRGLGALADPVVDAVKLHLETVSLGAGIVGADRFDRVAIAAGTGFGNNNAVMRLVNSADAGETDFESHDDKFADQFLVEKRKKRRGHNQLVKPLLPPLCSPSYAQSWHRRSAQRRQVHSF